jgi:hypothetical protein
MRLKTPRDGVSLFHLDPANDVGLLSQVRYCARTPWETTRTLLWISTCSNPAMAPAADVNTAGPYKNAPGGGGQARGGRGQVRARMGGSCRGMKLRQRTPKPFKSLWES